jgi:RNA polymerase sigma factor (sigma-70 family)
MDMDVEPLVGAAKNGDSRALENLVRGIQDRVYGLALRMLYDPADAEDASQEILVKIITNLGSFKGESAFTTWMYRVAANHLLTLRKHRAEREAVSFEEYEKGLAVESTENWQEAHAESLRQLFVEEIRISCLQGLLLCLDRPHRLAYLLVDVFDVSSEQGAEILNITPTAFRKRLSRAHQRLHDFLTKNCAFANPGNPCTCEQHAVVLQTRTGRNERTLMFANHPCRVRHGDCAVHRVKEMDELNSIGALFLRHPDFQAPTVFLEQIRKLIHSEKYELF